uniref:Uncharacterized protein n=1 Tax=Arundo donax TaxID=35708 RepID=A0A0A9DPE9_ARUDO
MTEMLRDMAYGVHDMGDANGSDGCSGDDSEGVEDFYKLLDDASQELYPGCKDFSKLSFLVRLFHTKSLGGMECLFVQNQRASKHVCEFTSLTLFVVIS